VWRCLRDPMFSHFRKTPTCDGRTNRQDTRRQLIPALASVARVLATLETLDTRGIWHNGNALVLINEVNLRWARLVLGWVSFQVQQFISVCKGQIPLRTLSWSQTGPRLVADLQRAGIWPII